MTRDNDRSRLFTRRAILLGGAKAGLFSLLAGRIYYLQIIQGDKYRTLAEENRISLRLIAPPRGQILDSNGTPLAVNQQNYRVVLLPEQVDDLDELLDGIAKYADLTETDRKRIARDLKEDTGLNAVLVHDNLTWDQVASISLHTLDLPGAEIETGEVRSYSYGTSMAHILGYVGAVTEKELSDTASELTIPGFRIGKNGIEKQYDEVLRGTAGNVQLEVDARGRVVRELARNEPKAGSTIQLTIDAGLQQMVQQRLSGELSAAAVALDIHTGAVYALASHPGFDPNLFTYGISQTDWDRLNNDEHTPLMNKVISGDYAPGSTFKIITALAALEGDVATPEATVFCPGYLDLGDHRFHCWKHGGHGHVNMHQAMAGSCDTYFYDLGRRTGIDQLQATARRMGLGEKLGIDLPHERGGMVPSRAWKQATYNTPWQQGETLVTAIGQGYVLVTPLQLAVVAARVANGGNAVVPHLTRRIGSESVIYPPAPSLGIAPHHLETVISAMSGVVNEQIGTAYAGRIKDPAMAMAGKTGTAQVRRITTAQRAEGIPKNDNIPWLERDHALFTGFAPLDNPRYAASVVIEHGGSGAHIAAPIVRDILIECQKRDLAAKA